VKRGEFYRVAKPSASDPKRFRVFLIVSRQALIDSKFSTIVCAPVYRARHGLSTQVPVGIEEGLRHDGSIHCDGLVSLPKSMLTHFVGSLPSQRMAEVDRAVAVAVGVSASVLGAGHLE
jgi:mRNA interferase MazF